MNADAESAQDDPERQAAPHLPSVVKYMYQNGKAG